MSRNTRTGFLAFGLTAAFAAGGGLLLVTAAGERGGAVRPAAGSSYSPPEVGDDPASLARHPFWKPGTTAAAIRALVAQATHPGAPATLVVFDDGAAWDNDKLSRHLLLANRGVTVATHGTAGEFLRRLRAAADGYVARERYGAQYGD